MTTLISLGRYWYHANATSGTTKPLRTVPKKCYSGTTRVILSKDEKKGIELYKLAADNGSGFSANKLYYCYANGAWGVKKDIEVAKNYLFKAAEYGDAWGCYNLGRHYYLGTKYVAKDVDQAFVYIKKAADMGLVDACNSLAYLYENGIGVDKDPQKAKEYRDKTIADGEKRIKEWKRE